MRAAPAQYARKRWYQGRGVRSGSAQMRRYRGLPSYRGSGIETKFFDTALTATALATPAATAAWTGLEQNPTTVLCFNAPQQGTGASNREGRYITCESLQVEGMISVAAQADQTAADPMPVIKMWLVLDTQTNGGTATGLDSENVMTNPAATSLNGLSPLRNMLFSKRYKILKSICVELPTLPLSYDGTNMEQEGAHAAFSAFIPLKGIKTEFTANAGTVGDISTNGLFLCAATSSAALAPTISYNARLRFRG